MLKKFFNRLIKNNNLKKDEKILENTSDVQEETCITEEINILENDNKEIIDGEAAAIIVEENLEDIVSNVDEINIEKECEESKETIKEEIIKDNIENLDAEDIEYLKNIKIVRGQSIRAIDLYTEEEIIFKSHKECSRKLKLPLEYIVENLKYGYTDYLGEAIVYLSKELKYNEGLNYLDSNKTPLEIFNNLNNKIFTSNISEIKRDEILSNEKIEPVKMHYRFECIDEEYDDYFIKYKAIIKRGGKKKIELVDKNNEVIEIFKSLDECSKHLGKTKNEIVDMLKYKNTKVGRHEIRYSLRNI